MAVLGLRGSGNFGSVEREQNFRRGILLAFPNGDAPLTGLLSMVAEEGTDDPQYHWFEKGLPVQRAAIRGASASNPPSDGDDIATNQTADVYLKVRPDGASADDASIFKPGHVILNETSGENLLVLAVDTTNNTIKCRRDIGNKSATNPAINGGTTDATSDDIVIVGSGYPEGGSLTTSIAYSPVRHYNFTQIFRTSLAVTRTARKTRLRTDDSGPYREAKREAFQIHATEMEKAFLYGEREEITGLSGAAGELSNTSTGQPLRLTRGLANWLPTATTDSVSVHTNLDSYNSGVLTEAIWDEFLMNAFQYGSDEKLMLCGARVLETINQLAKNKAELKMVPRDQTYGLQLIEYLTPHGTLMIKKHPLMSHNPTWNKELFILDVPEIRYRYVDDTRFLLNRQAPGDDCSKDELLTECGLEVHFSGATPDNASPNTVATPAKHARMTGVLSYGG